MAGGIVPTNTCASIIVISNCRIYCNNAIFERCKLGCQGVATEKSLSYGGFRPALDRSRSQCRAHRWASLIPTCSSQITLYVFLSLALSLSNHNQLAGIREANIVDVADRHVRDFKHDWLVISWVKSPNSRSMALR